MYRRLFWVLKSFYMGSEVLEHNIPYLPLAACMEGEKRKMDEVKRTK
jgi:hypothetical protein